MPFFREIPPTAGWPVYSEDLLSLATAKTARGSLEDDVKNYLGTRYARVTNSGTAALYVILEVLKKSSLKRTVIVPAYVCPLVPLAIHRAGLRVEVCDIGEDFNFSAGTLEQACSQSEDILAVVAVHLAGMPLDFETLEKTAKKYGIYVIEDCAQSLGAQYKGRLTGTLGDFSFFSLARGKGLTVYEGGVLATSRDDYVSALDTGISRLLKRNALSESVNLLELLGYWLFYRPQLFWFVFRLPQIWWSFWAQPYRASADYFNLRFPVYRVSLLRKSVGHAAFHRLEGQLSRQRQQAADYLSALEHAKGIRAIREPAHSKASYPFVTVVFDDPAKKEKALRAFAHTGLGVSEIYSLAITDYSYLSGVVPQKHCPAARGLAERAITLSTSAFLTEDDLSRVVAILRNI